MKTLNLSAIAVYGLSALAISGFIYGIVMAVTGHFHHVAAL